MRRLRPHDVVLALGFSMIFASPILGAEGTEFYDEQEKHHFVPKDGFVPNEETAIRIAEAIWQPIYGEVLEDERPFHATLVGEVWYVKGSLSEHMLGGVAEAEVNKSDGKILRVSHGE